MKEKIGVSVCWFRRDLRLEDNAALYHALRSKYPVIAVFIFDTTILDRLEDKQDRRVVFIHQSLVQMEQKLNTLKSSLVVLHATPLEAWHQLLAAYDVKETYANHDYEPYAIARDQSVSDVLAAQGIPFYTYKDQCIFEKNEVLKDDGSPYTVYTPYSRRWKQSLNSFFLKSYPTEKYFYNFLPRDPKPIPTLASIGFADMQVDFPTPDIREDQIRQYTEQRNFPGIEGTSKISVHLRFGTVSIRKLVRTAMELNETWLNELIWREFYMMILWHFPTVVHKAFKPDYDMITWRNNETEFEAWCQGNTGYPIVDAGMRELNATGFMHNRVRMITASFLTKHLLIDWRWGEAYFAKKLIDYDLAANNGGWQWVAGAGCDAAPYFRVFNPALQTAKFDQDHAYIKKWVPEFEDPFVYAKPIVDHELARVRVLDAYAVALKNKS